MQAVAISYPNFEFISFCNNRVKRVLCWLLMAKNTLIRMFWDLRGVLQNIYG